MSQLRQLNQKLGLKVLSDVIYDWIKSNEKKHTKIIKHVLKHNYYTLNFDSHVCTLEVKL